MSLRQLYRTLELPGKHPVKDADFALGEAVRAAYGISAREDTLAFLLDLNHELARSEAECASIVGPGLPPFVEDARSYITTDCIGLSSLPSEPLEVART